MNDKATALGVPLGPERKTLIAGKPITLSDGRVVNPDDVLGELQRGSKLVMTGDTGDTESLIKICKEADVLVLFSRRRFPPKEQMAAIRAHLEAGKPLVGIRTANHAFLPKPKDIVDPSLAPWPEFTHEVLGGENTGYETKGLPYRVSVAKGAEGSPLLAGVNAANIFGYLSLYKVLPLAENATPLLIGTPQAGATTPPQPIAWTRTYGTNKARVFFTSLGAPQDMQIADVRRLLVNAVNWSLTK